MQRRAVRYSIVIVLVAVGAGAGAVAWNGQQRLRPLIEAERDVAVRLDRLAGSLADLAAAQRSYMVLGGAATPAFERVSADAQQIANDLSAVRPQARSAGAASALNVLTEDLAALIQIDARVRDHLTAGEQLEAEGLIQGAAHEGAASMAGRLKGLREAEAAAYRAERAAIDRQTWSAIAGAAALWMIGLIALAPVPKPPAAPAAEPVADATAPATSHLANPEPDAPDPMSIDLAAAADVCTAISRVTTTDALPELLARAANVLDASGLIVWMGGGDELFAAASHGYDAKIISRLGTIKRTAENATAAAWRTATVKTVAGDMMSNGAIVAPMFAPDGCIGVLAAEVRHGREKDIATRAVASMIAAQLATAIAAWPAASTDVDDPVSGVSGQA